MLEEIKKSSVTILITLATTLVALAGGWANLNARVEAHEIRLREVVSKTEFNAITSGQQEIIKELRYRFGRLESRIDRIQEVR